MGKAVFLLHGWLSDGNDFKALLPHLEKHYERLEVITYPGHGPDEDYLNFRGLETVGIVEEKFRKVVEEHETDVIGFSMGGALAAYLASKYPVRKLVLLAPGNKYFNLRLPFSKLKFLLKTIYAYQKALFMKDEERKEELRWKLRFVFRDDLTTLRALKDRWFRRYVRHAYRNFRELIDHVNANTGEINCPCFLAWGRLDQLIPKASIDYLAGLCTNECKVIKIYDYMSHLLLLSPDCEELVQDIMEFLVEGGNT